MTEHNEQNKITKKRSQSNLLAHAINERDK